MPLTIRKTGPYGFGLMYHVIHLGEDVNALTEWYREVFDADVWWGDPEPNYSGLEKRYATMLDVSDLCVEPMAPEDPADAAAPVARSFSRYGRHFHSVAFMVDDIYGFAQHLLDRGVYIGKPGGGRMEEVPDDIVYFYPSPRDVGGLMVQVTRFGSMNGPAVDPDPRMQDDWEERRKHWSEGPIGIERLAYVTVGVRDLEASRKTFQDLWLAEPVWEGEDLGRGVDSCFLQLGHLLIELAEPHRNDSHLARHVEQFGDLIYGVTFKVKDVDQAGRHLTSKGVRSRLLTHAVLAAEPDDCHGGTFFFASETVPGDPFEV
ncbi:MAG: VOC family protein [Acidobacteria bacterium]|nr:VOC family protein [Acidobacteriota bacterium]